MKDENNKEVVTTEEYVDDSHRLDIDYDENAIDEKLPNGISIDGDDQIVADKDTLNQDAYDKYYEEYNSSVNTTYEPYNRVLPIDLPDEIDRKTPASTPPQEIPLPVPKTGMGNDKDSIKTGIFANLLYKVTGSKKIGKDNKKNK